MSLYELYFVLMVVMKWDNIEYKSFSMRVYLLQVAIEFVNAFKSREAVLKVASKQQPLSSLFYLVLQVATIVNILLDRFFDSLCDSVSIRLLLFASLFIDPLVFLMGFCNMSVIIFSFLELEAAMSALESFAEMNDLDMSVQVMLISKAHDAIWTFVVQIAS